MIKIFNVNEFTIGTLPHINDVKFRDYPVIRITVYYRYFFEIINSNK